MGIEALLPRLPPPIQLMDPLQITQQDLAGLYPEIQRLSLERTNRYKRSRHAPHCSVSQILLAPIDPSTGESLRLQTTHPSSGSSSSAARGSRALSQFNS